MLDDGRGVMLKESHACKDGATIRVTILNADGTTTWMLFGSRGQADAYCKTLAGKRTVVDMVLSEARVSVQPASTVRYAPKGVPAHIRRAEARKAKEERETVYV